MAREALYFIHDNVDYIFEEKGNSFSAIRKIQWANPGDEPDPEKARLEIRKWYVNEEGEKIGKGFTFSTEDGPNELINTFIKNGYGNTKDILSELKKRDDFVDAVKSIYDETDHDDEDDGEYFDAREVLIS